MEPEVLIVDDHGGARSSLCQVVEAAAGLHLAGAVDSGEAAIAFADGSAVPLLVVMDVRMPGMGGAEATRTLRRSERGHVVVLTSTDGETGSILAAELGVPFVGKSRLSGSALLRAWTDATGRADCLEPRG